MKRWLTLGAVGLVMAVIAIPASAEDSNLSDLLEQGMKADFAGSGVVMASAWGQSTAATYEVSRVGGMAAISGGSGASMSKGSETAAMRNGEWYGFSVDAWRDWTLSDRYRLGDPQPVLRIGRPATEVWIHEGSVRRVRLVVDDATSVPLVTEVYDGSGEVYRTAVLLELGDPVVDSDMPDMHDMDEMKSIDPPATLPASVAGYQRADAYAGPDSMAQVFYSDGLFSFSVFEWDRGLRPDGFDAAAEVDHGGHRYLTRVTPTEVWVHWNAPDRGYLLVGDLPPDHLDDVLAELPEPGERGWLIRLWRWLFG